MCSCGVSEKLDLIIVGFSKVSPSERGISHDVSMGVATAVGHEMSAK